MLPSLRHHDVHPYSVQAYEQHLFPQNFFLGEADSRQQGGREDGQSDDEA